MWPERDTSSLGAMGLQPGGWKAYSRRWSLSPPLPSPSPAWALAQALVRVLARTLPRAHGPLLEEEEEKERYPVLPEEVYFLLERRLLREDEDSLLPKDEDLLLRPDEEYLDLPPEEGYLLFPEA